MQEETVHKPVFDCYSGAWVGSIYERKNCKKQHDTASFKRYYIVLVQGCNINSVIASKYFFSSGQLSLNLGKATFKIKNCHPQLEKRMPQK